MDAEQFAAAMRDKGHRVAVLNEDYGDGVNVWRHREDRAPADTVWFFPNNPGVSWGPNFEHVANAGDPSLTERVIETLR